MTESNPCIFGPLLGPLHDGELSDDRRQEVLDHLRTCPHCPAELGDIRRFSGVLGTASLPSLPAGRMEAMFDEAQRIVAQPETTQPEPVVASPRLATRSTEPGHLRYVRWASGIAAAIFLLAMGQLVYVKMTTPTNPTIPTSGAPNKVTVDPTTSPAEKAPLQRQ